MIEDEPKVLNSICSLLVLPWPSPFTFWSCVLKAFQAPTTGILDILTPSKDGKVPQHALSNFSALSTEGSLEKVVRREVTQIKQPMS